MINDNYYFVNFPEISEINKLYNLFAIVINL